MKTLFVFIQPLISVHSCFSRSIPRSSKLVERSLAFDAVELFGFPVDALFDHFETVGGGLEHDPLRAGTEVGRCAGTQGSIQQPATNAQ